MAGEVWFTVAELAALWRCSKNFIYDEIKRGRLDATNLGPGRAKTRIPQSAIDEYARRNSRKKAA